MRPLGLISFFVWTLKHFIKYIRYYFFAICSLFILHYSSSLLPNLAKDSLNILESSGQENKKIMISLILLAMVLIIARTASRWIFFLPARIFQRQMRLDYMNTLSQLDDSQLQKFTAGQLYQYLMNDCDYIRAYLGFALLQIFNVIIALLILIPKINQDYSNLLITLSPLMLAIILMVIVVSFTQGWYKQGLSAQEKLQNFILESFAGKKDIKSLKREESFIDLFENDSRKESFFFFKASLVRSIVRPLLVLAAGCSFVWSSWILIDQGEVGDVIAFSTFIYLLLDPLMFLTWIGVVVANGHASWVRLEIFNSKLAHQTQPAGVFSQVDEAHLQKVLQYTQARLIGFCGPTGCGKSRLLQSLALRLKKDGKKISYVAQNPYFFEDTIEMNLTLGHQVAAEKLIELFSVFNLGDLFSDPYVFLKRELEGNGNELSGGQKKRLALIRSLVSDADILLWDDPFSSIDYYSEKKIWRKLKEQGFLEDKTIYICSHRVLTLSQLDGLFFFKGSNQLVFYCLKEREIEQNSDLAYFFQRQLQGV